MKEIIVEEKDAGQRLDKLLGRCLRSAPKSFFYKMLRKKNITLNGKKAAGSELVQPGDCVRLYISEETYKKFSAQETTRFIPCAEPLPKELVIYEDRHILVADKPSGTLSQKGDAGDVSLNEQILAYLAQKGEVTTESLRTFRPSVCNRLDRNTSGLVLFGKSLAGTRELSRCLRDRSLHKYYLCLVKGRTMQKMRMENILVKDQRTNRVSVAEAGKEGQEGWENAAQIRTECSRLWTDGAYSLLEVWLITGRAHQIRAHLAYIGHPIIGDGKYGDAAENRKFRSRFGVKSQLLHAWRVSFPALEGELSYLSGRTLEAPLPAEFARVAEALGVPGNLFQ